ncbi:MAG: hypothetical protein AAGJ46_07635 [Planctomycetota bacterium]
MGEETQRRLQSLNYLAALPLKDFVQFFYEATESRQTSDSGRWRGHLALGDAERVAGEPWRVDILALGDDGWAADTPLCQSTVCECGNAIRSWSNHMICPVCQTPQRGT